jgi:hypothetical protein
MSTWLTIQVSVYKFNETGLVESIDDVISGLPCAVKDNFAKRSLFELLILFHLSHHAFRQALKLRHVSLALPCRLGQPNKALYTLARFMNL